MARPSNNFMREDLDERPALTYGDGFRFGFGAFVAFLIGTLLVAAVAAGVTIGLNALR